MQNSYWEDLLPMALECGMTPTQFWEEEPRLVKSFIIKHKMEQDEFNYKAWLLNIYTFNAVITAIGQAFADKKSANKIHYFEKPIEELYINRKTKSQEEKKEITNNKYRKQVNFWAKFGKKGG